MCSRKLANGSYPQQEKASPHHHVILSWDSFYYTPPNISPSSNFSLSFRISTQNTIYIHITFHACCTVHPSQPFTWSFELRLWSYSLCSFFQVHIILSILSKCNILSTIFWKILSDHRQVSTPYRSMTRIHTNNDTSLILINPTESGLLHCDDAEV
jgi:hypothetical protein